ncbi:DNA excision repair protein ERCC-6-like [Chelonus insularis]|uniref:DNA excision repair protein ERCC-6-like n=1 Tax=Chelonus insularis TaxID=460826 RepID=UPI00158E3375|nr:DNA excision repair protein ERCC-6-like [Chelonus insularis]XP_034942015.1 DNA excision repair protein ERCC-6-like [Chelonus insularis]XP_034942016.1 DNA excision repair protein ERCC-6-like [Chelonus insularis]
MDTDEKPAEDEDNSAKTSLYSNKEYGELSNNELEVTKQNSQFSTLNDNDIIDDQVHELKEIVNIRSEASIHQELSLQVKTLSAKKNTNSKACKGTLEEPTLTETQEIVLNNHQENPKILEIEKQVQTGEITPFEADLKKKSAGTSANVFNATTGLLDLEKYLRRQAEVAAKKKKQKPVVEQKLSKEKKSQNSIKKCTKSHKRERKKSTDSFSEKKSSVDLPTSSSVVVNPSKLPKNTTEDGSDTGSEYIPSDEELSDEDNKKRPTKRKKSLSESVHKKRILDDGDESLYRKRIEHRKFKSSSLRTVDNLFKVPKSLWKKLYEYQKVSVRWLWELHGRNLGGLLGDEMGLGKTVQVIAFFAGLDCSELLSDGGRFRGLGPTLIVCPATLLEQWVQHFHDWWPSLRVVTLHQSGTHRGEPEELLESLKTGGILLTSYSGVLRHVDILVPFQWHYVVLDEGHKIRNPQAKVTKVVKKFSTPHRLLLTGSPMQNSLKELWSLFDFILPGKLGTLDAFIEHCATPITRGGYANASSLQEATAFQVATMLKDAISPYMLRRTKNDVKHHISLPEKNEQVLFCSLTEEQTNLYKEFLRSEHVSTILHDKSSVQGDGKHRARLLVALTTLRKICNHPDLYIYDTYTEDSDQEMKLDEDIDLEKFGYWKKSGKMTVVRSLLKIWKSQGHRVLLFTQGRQMLHILEALIQQEKYSYLRLDGSTPMVERQRTIRKFNEDTSYLVFISTTRVGGLGINLTGADRVVIYDPDWNPATDTQARERAWRIGQNKKVTIYRLITVGTIEEKIYHRQIYKLLLSNKILDDPRQRRLFQTSDLTELFHLNEPIDGAASESDRLFGSSNVKRNHLQNDGKNSDSHEKNHEKKRSHKNKKISALFEGEEISCLAGRRLAHSEEEDKSVVDDDNYVLKKLFSKTTVSSALEHETILSSVKLDSDTATPMQKLARETAQESMEFVRQSRKWCWRPSWD